MPRLAIAIVLHSNIRSGSNLVCFLLARYLAGQGPAVTVLFQERFFPADIDFFDPAPLFQVGFLDALAARPAPFDMVMTTWWECAYQSFPRLPARGYALFRHGAEKALYDAHGRFFDAVIDAVLREDLLVFCVNSALHKEMAAAGRPALLVRNGVDYARFAAAAPSLPPKSGRLRVVVEGPLDDDSKRVREALRAVGTLAEVEIVHLAARGDSPAGLRVDHSCIAVPYQAVPGILASADLIVKMGSAETWSLPVLETFAAGGTAIVGAFPGHQDYIAHGENALVVALDDWDGLRHALQRLLDDTPLLARLRAVARATAERLSWEEPFAAVEAAFARVARERAPGTVAPTPLLDRYRACHQAILNLWLRAGRS